MVPYLSAYLTLITSNGPVEVFNGCRVLSNLSDPVKVDSGWDIDVGEGNWGGYCHPFWTVDGPDPWATGYDRSSNQVAGFLIDPPDKNSHGFYLEPSGSTRIFEATGLEPLEMYVTGSVVCGSSASERAWLRWVDTTLSMCARNGVGAVVYTGTPCLEDLGGVRFENDVLFRADWGFPQPVHSGVCDPAMPVHSDTDVGGGVDVGYRFIPQVRYLGFEQLTSEGLWECGGNRYKFMFDVYSHLWFGANTFVGGVQPEGFDSCAVFDVSDWSRCDHTVLVDCDGNTGPTGSGGERRRGGLIGKPGRYNRPSRVNVKAFLTAPISGRHTAAVNLKPGPTPVSDVRVTVWAAADGAPPPDTAEGWSYYSGVPPLARMDIPKVDTEWQVNPDGTSLKRCADGTIQAADGWVDIVGCGFDAAGPVWFVIETPADTDGLFAEFYLATVEAI